MNFLAHYHTTNKNITPYKLLGVILPDLAKDFSRIYNKNIEQGFVSDSAHISEMLSGIKLHIKGDDLFHKHPIFKKNEMHAKVVLEMESEISVKRKFVIAHVLVELLIDQYIIINYPEELDNFYAILDEIDIEKANELFQSLDVKEEKSHFVNNFSFFRERKFIYNLKENKGVLFTLDKVFGTIFDYNFLENNYIWMDVIENIKFNLEKELPLLLEELKEQLNE